MTIDEQGNPIHEMTPVTGANLSPLAVDMTETIVKNSPSLLENPDMLRSTFALVANSIVEASDLAAEVKHIREELAKISNSLLAAIERETRALAERDLALAERDAAVRAAEIADQAYETVNGLRIAAETEAHDLREALATRTTNYNTLHGVNVDLAARITELEAEVLRLTADHDAYSKEAATEMRRLTDKARDYEDLYALAEEDKKRLTVELDNTRQDRNAHEADAEIAWKEANSCRNKLAEIRAIVG
jgi:chromosome segregation ATPase